MYWQNQASRLRDPAEAILSSGELCLTSPWWADFELMWLEVRRRPILTEMAHLDTKHLSVQSGGSLQTSCLSLGDGRQIRRRRPLVGIFQKKTCWQSQLKATGGLPPSIPPHLEYVVGVGHQALWLNLQGKTGWLAGPQLRQLLGCCHKKEMVTRPTCRMKWDVCHIRMPKSLLMVWLYFLVMSGDGRQPGHFRLLA